MTFRFLKDSEPEDNSGRLNDAAEWRAAIPSHSTETVNGEWDGPGTVADAPNDPAVLRYMHAWYSGENPDQKGSYKFPHHAGRVGSAANMNGVRNGLARLANSSIPEGDKSGVERHLRRHLEDGGGGENSQAPAFVKSARRETDGPPAGKARMQSFPCELRVKLVTRNGKPMYEVEGYASVFEKGYQMWDMFGPYTEVVDHRAFEKTMSKDPDVSFLVNHRGVTMARTTNQSLELYTDSVGFGAHAFLNAERQDVRDLASAIDDELVTEMSFAFMLNDGEWDEEMETFRIREVDINRGDVSAVNYGANPYTSISARAAEWLSEADKVPAPVARAALDRLINRHDIYSVETVAEDSKEAEGTPMGDSWDLEYNRLLMDIHEMQDEEDAFIF